TGRSTPIASHRSRPAKSPAMANAATRSPTLRATISEIVARCAVGSGLPPAIYTTEGGPPTPNRAPVTPSERPRCASHARPESPHPSAEAATAGWSVISAINARPSIIGLRHPPALAVIMTAPPVPALRLQISRAMVVPLYRNEESHGYRDSAARRDRLADLGP